MSDLAELLGRAFVSDKWRLLEHRRVGDHNHALDLVAVQFNDSIGADGRPFERWFVIPRDLHDNAPPRPPHRVEDVRTVAHLLLNISDEQLEELVQHVPDGDPELVTISRTRLRELLDKELGYEAIRAQSEAIYDEEEWAAEEVSP